jgi:3(or 17)beta-hydroxysteroid dehydrogenase
MSPVEERQAGRVAVVTGGTRGIGLAIARRLLAERAQAVVVTGRDAARGAEAAAELGGRAHFVPQDATSEKNWDELVGEVTARFGGLDVLVNNAGWAGPAGQDPQRTALEDWREVFAANLDSAFLGCRAAIGAMAPGGAIVNLSSTAGVLSTPAFVAYGAAKAAVAHLTASVAVYCARRGNGIRCNAVLPALIDTDLGTDILHRFDPDPAAALSGYLGRVPLGRLGVPDDVAAAVAYLASDDARYVTAARLVVAGGLGA